MPPRGPGGRPPNAWTGRRSRKLIRLYTLTTLDKEQIRKLLETKRFNPSSSDIQKKLRTLLSRDYAKEHRKFRPSRTTDGRRRLKQIRRCDQRRISKPQKSSSSASTGLSSRWSGTTSTLLSEKSDILAAAFRNYVKSVLRYSSASSWRSSLVSVTSGSSDLRSKTPSTQQSRRSIRSVELAHIFSDFQLPLPNRPMTIEEDEIWNELIEEERLAPASTEFPAEFLPSSDLRVCCYHSHGGCRCMRCGFSPAHYYASRVDHLYSEVQHVSLKVQDNFGSAPLHYACASGRGPDILYDMHLLLRNGADPLVINTFGQTMLHVLRPMHPMTPADLSSFYSLLRTLSASGFSLTHRDYYGRTILHNLLKESERTSTSSFSLEAVDTMLGIYKLDVNTFDIFGQSIFSLIAKTGPIKLHQASQGRLGLIYRRYGNQDPTTVHHSTILSLANDQVYEWQERITSAGLSNWIDLAGNSPLIAILKTWSCDRDGFELNGIIKELIAKGAQIHMRDRNGDTALAIATVRGFRPIAVTLLAAGANVHSRDFTGAGILFKGKEAMRKAILEGREEQYAMIMSCLALLVEAGAVSNPTGEDEWRTEN